MSKRLANEKGRSAKLPEDIENDVAFSLSNGEPTQSIADRLRISRRTVQRLKANLALHKSIRPPRKGNQGRPPKFTRDMEEVIYLCIYTFLFMYLLFFYFYFYFKEKQKFKKNLVSRQLWKKKI